MRKLRRNLARISSASTSKHLGFSLVVVLVLCLGAGVDARTWQVPADVGTIKAALEDSSAYGDTVLVAAATYDTTSGEVFPIAMADGVVLLSEGGAEMTVIDAGLTGRVFDCIDLDSTTIIEGFTITGGSQIQGGGIYCLNSDVAIQNNIITNNTATGTTAQGGGIYCNGSAPRIVANEITANKARKNMGGGMFCGGGTAAVIESNNISGNVAKFGGGIFMQYCGPLIKGNTVTQNRSTATGAGVDCSFNSYAVVTENVIIHNRATSDGSGIACCYGATPTITYNTIAGNTGTFGGGVRSLGNSSPAIWANIIVDNVDGIYLMDDNDSMYAHANNMYYNSYQSGDYEVVNNTTYRIDLTDNHWEYSDSLLIAGLISGPADFVPFKALPIDTVPGEPSAVSSVIVMEDASYSSPLIGLVTLGDTLFIELDGTDWNGAFVEPGIVIISSSQDPVGVAVALIETGPATGVYRGQAYVDSVSDDLLDRIGVDPADEITVRANVNPAVFCTVPVAIAAVTDRSQDASPNQVDRVLCSNWPDPFSSETEIAFMVPVTGRVTVEIYDVFGRLVETLVNDRRMAGRNSVTWDACDRDGKRAADGIYFCRIAADGIQHVDKMILLR